MSLYIGGLTLDFVHKDQIDLLKKYGYPTTGLMALAGTTPSADLKTLETTLKTNSPSSASTTPPALTLGKDQYGQTVYGANPASSSPWTASAQAAQPTFYPGSQAGTFTPTPAPSPDPEGYIGVPPGERDPTMPYFDTNGNMVFPESPSIYTTQGIVGGVSATAAPTASSTAPKSALAGRTVPTTGTATTTSQPKTYGVFPDGYMPKDSSTYWYTTPNGWSANYGPQDRTAYPQWLTSKAGQQSQAIASQPQSTTTGSRLGGTTTPIANTNTPGQAQNVYAGKVAYYWINNNNGTYYAIFTDQTMGGPYTEADWKAKGYTVNQTSMPPATSPTPTLPPTGTPSGQQPGGGGSALTDPYNYYTAKNPPPDAQSGKFPNGYVPQSPNVRWRVVGGNLEIYWGEGAANETQRYASYLHTMWNNDPNIQRPTIPGVDWPPGTPVTPSPGSITDRPTDPITPPAPPIQPPINPSPGVINDWDAWYNNVYNYSSSSVVNNYYNEQSRLVNPTTPASWNFSNTAQALTSLVQALVDAQTNYAATTQQSVAPGRYAVNAATANNMLGWYDDFTGEFHQWTPTQAQPEPPSWVKQYSAPGSGQLDEMMTPENARAQMAPTSPSYVNWYKDQQTRLDSVNPTPIVPPEWQDFGLVPQTALDWWHESGLPPAGWSPTIPGEPGTYTYQAAKPEEYYRNENIVWDELGKINTKHIPNSEWYNKERNWADFYRAGALGSYGYLEGQTTAMDPLVRLQEQLLGQWDPNIFDRLFNPTVGQQPFTPGGGPPPPTPVEPTPTEPPKPYIPQPITWQPDIYGDVPDSFYEYWNLPKAIEPPETWPNDPGSYQTNPDWLQRIPLSEMQVYLNRWGPEVAGRLLWERYGAIGWPTDWPTYYYEGRETEAAPGGLSLPSGIGTQFTNWLKTLPANWEPLPAGTPTLLPVGQEKYPWSYTATEPPGSTHNSPIEDNGPYGPIADPLNPQGPHSGFDWVTKEGKKMTALEPPIKNVGPTPDGYHFTDPKSYWWYDQNGQVHIKWGSTEDSQGHSDYLHEKMPGQMYTGTEVSPDIMKWLADAFPEFGAPIQTGEMLKKKLKEEAKKVFGDVLPWDDVIDDLVGSWEGIKTDIGGSFPQLPNLDFQNTWGTTLENYFKQNYPQKTLNGRPIVANPGDPAEVGWDKGFDWESYLIRLGERAKFFNRAPEMYVPGLMETPPPAPYQPSTEQIFSDVMASQKQNMSMQLEDKALAAGTPGIYRGILGEQERSRQALVEQAAAKFEPLKYDLQKQVKEQESQLLNALAQADLESRRMLLTSGRSL